MKKQLIKTQQQSIRLENKNFKSYFYVSDIETFVLENKHVPYAIGVYNTQYDKIYFIGKEPDYDKFKKNAYGLIIHSIQDLLEYELSLFTNLKIVTIDNGDKIKVLKNKITLVFHNLSSFDGFFILKAFYNYDGIQLLNEFLCNILKIDTTKSKTTVVVKPLIRDNTILCIDINFIIDGKTFKFIRIILSLICLRNYKNSI